MDEVSSHVCLNLPFELTTRPRIGLFYLFLESHDGRAPGADSEEKREPVSDIDTAAADSLKALDPNRPIREADLECDGAIYRNFASFAVRGASSEGEAASDTSLSV